jgi:hypothetical protein
MRGPFCYLLLVTGLLVTGLLVTGLLVTGKVFGECEQPLRMLA